MPTDRPSIMIDGKKTYRMAGMIFWYRWGNQEFDIRQIRRLLNLKTVNERDWHAYDSDEILAEQLRDITTAAAALQLNPPLTFRRIIRRYKAENHAEAKANNGQACIQGDSQGWGKASQW